MQTEPMTYKATRIGLGQPNETPRKALGKMWVGRSSEKLHRQYGCGWYAESYIRVVAWMEGEQPMFERNGITHMAEICDECDYYPPNDWMEEAACKGTAIDFLSAKRGDIMEATKVCDTCPVIRECFDDAVARKSVGTWGGMYFRQDKTTHAAAIEAHIQEKGWT